MVAGGRERIGDLSESERLRELLYQAVHAHGLNPEDIFLLLTRLLDREFPEEPGEDLEVKGQAFRRLVETEYPAGLGIKPADRLTAIVRDFRHPHEGPPRLHTGTAEKMARMRTRVNQLLPGKAAGYGGNRSEQEENLYLPNNRTAQGIIRRLNRDDPELARRVAAGEISANRAAEQAGYRPRKCTVRMDDPESAARTLRKNMPRDVLTDLVRILTEKEG